LFRPCPDPAAQLHIRDDPGTREPDASPDSCYLANLL